MDKLYKQPNGKYCFLNAWSNKLDSNLSEEDVVDRFVDEAKDFAKEVIKRALSYPNIIADINPKYHGLPSMLDAQLADMGFDKSYKELIKHIPREPIDKEYHDFTTYGRCPCCGKRVSICMDRGIKSCECGQKLKWE
jgi:hypothetical protein